MATLKINYNGTIYSMVKTSSKITTPSVAVDGGWIPCFKGDRFAEVTHGYRIYTLSPLMVNGYRMACGQRIIPLRVYGQFWLYGNYIFQANIFSSRYQCKLEKLYVTDQDNHELSDFTVSATGFYWYDTGQVIGIKSSDSVTYSGDITVTHNDISVLTTHYNVSIPIYSNNVNGGEKKEYRNILLASS